MALYAYRAIDADGRPRQGEMDAANDADLEGRLDKMGLTLVRCRSVRQRGFSLARRKIGRQELITLCFQLEQLTSAGVPILDGLRDLRGSLDKGPLKDLVAELVDNIEGGSQLSQAMERHPKVFGPIFVSLVRAGEVSGEMERVFRRLTDNLKWEDELIAQTKKLLMYPAFAGSVVLGVSAFLLLYLVPQLAGFIRNMNSELPTPTRILLGLSEFLQHYWYTLPLALAALVVGLVLYARSGPMARLRIDEWKLRLWIVGPLLKKIALARFAGFFGMMYAAGVTVLEALEVGERIAGNRVIETAIRRARTAILNGMNIADGFAATGIFPPLVQRMIKIGETTGELDKAMMNVNYFYDREIKEGIGRLQALVEPALTVILGLLLGSIMYAVLGPIYDIISKLKT